MVGDLPPVPISSKAQAIAVIPNAVAWFRMGWHTVSAAAVVFGDPSKDREVAVFELDGPPTKHIFFDIVRKICPSAKL